MATTIQGDNLTVPGIALLAALRLTRTTVSLIADNQVVTTAGKGHIALSSDNATAGNRTFVLGPGVSGQLLLLEWSGANAAELVDDAALDGGTGNARLSATWTPTANDTILLVFNGLDWLEIARSAN